VGCLLHLRKSLLTCRKPDTYDGTDIFHGFLPLLRVLLWCVILAPMTSAILNRSLAAYYLPLYFQILGASPTKSGVL
jgi:hypothetical protein